MHKYVKGFFQLLIVPCILVHGVIADVASDTVYNPGWSESVVLGVREIKTAEQIFRFVNGRDVKISITPEGLVKLHFPEYLPSRSGDNQTRAWVMNSYMIPLNQEDREALSTTGLKLPEGNHTFYVYYIDPDKATTVEALRGNWWEIMMNPDTYQNFTADAEYALLEVKDIVPEPSLELKITRSIEGVSWYPQYQQTEARLELPEGKRYGITKRVDGIPATRLVEQGTCIQAVYEDVNNNNVPYNRTWTTHRAYARGEVRIPFSSRIAAGETLVLEQNGLDCRPGDIISLHKGFSNGLPAGVEFSCEIPEMGTFRFVVTNNREDAVQLEGTFEARYFGNLEEEAEKLYQHSSRRGNIMAAEICENGIPFDEVEAIFRRVYEMQVAREGVTSPNDTAILADYFAHLYGYGTEFSWRLSQDEKRVTFRSTDAARRGASDAPVSRYYTDKAYEYRHRLLGAYLDSIARLLDGVRLYTHIANLERQYIAMDDRRVGTFGWTAFEGIDSLVERAGVWQRLPLDNGDLLRVSRMEGSFEQLKYEVFFSLLIGDYYLSWNDNAPIGTDINYFGLAHIGGAADWKNLWQPEGAEEPVQYDPGDPSHPKSVGEGRMWSDGVAPGHNGGFAGAWLLSNIAKRVDHSLRYPAFSYSIDGVMYPGYFDGVQPQLGISGTAEVSRFKNANIGQYNILNQQEYRKPIVLYGEGSEGSCLIVLNPYAGLNSVTSYQLLEGTERTIQHTGPSLGVYCLD